MHRRPRTLSARSAGIAAACLVCWLGAAWPAWLRITQRAARTSGSASAHAEHATRAAPSSASPRAHPDSGDDLAPYGDQVSTEEDRGKAALQARRDEAASARERSWASETRDPSWAPQQEADLREQLVASGMQASGLRALECRRTTCRLEIALGNGGSVASLAQAATFSLTEQVVYRSAADPSLLTIFVSRWSADDTTAPNGGPREI